MGHTFSCREHQWGKSTVLYFADAWLISPLLNGFVLFVQTGLKHTEQGKRTGPGFNLTPFDSCGRSKNVHTAGQNPNRRTLVQEVTNKDDLLAWRSNSQGVKICPPKETQRLEPLDKLAPSHTKHCKGCPLQLPWIQNSTQPCYTRNP